MSYNHWSSDVVGIRYGVRGPYGEFDTLNAKTVLGLPGPDKVPSEATCAVLEYKDNSRKIAIFHKDNVKTLKRVQVRDDNGQMVSAVQTSEKVTLRYNPDDLILALENGQWVAAKFLDGKFVARPSFLPPQNH